jgi:4-hydroxy 2-oxovalerate aldolase
MNSSASLKILDCTFRDGGYYNNWYYEPNTVKRYLSSVVAAAVDIVEIGFRFPAQKSFCGPFAYSTDEFLRTLEIPGSLTVSVMINAKDYLPTSTQISSRLLIREAFAQRKGSPVGIVRIAAHFKEIDACAEMVEELASLGYRIGFNLMQATGKTSIELRDAAKLIASWKHVEVLYFADSFGNMKPLQIKEMTEALRAGWQGELGFHAHDNMGLGLSNSLEAIRHEVTWIDSTILGMGRGAGNTQTENLLVELVSQGCDRYKPEALFALVLEDFTALKNQYAWGSNLLYYLSAAYCIHPTYVQELLFDNNRDSQHILDSLEYLRTSKLATSYDSKRFARSLYGSSVGAEGKWNAKTLCHSGEVVIVGPGAGAKEHQHAINAFLKLSKSLVLVTNIVDIVNRDAVTAHIACHHTKLMLDYDRYKTLGKPIILPESLVPEHSKASLRDVEVWDYGLKVNEELDHVSVFDNYCELPSNLVAGYALAIAIASGAKIVFMAGFDGFGSADPRHIEMQMILDHFKQSYPKTRFIAITPTTYKMEHGSVYSPGIASPLSQ